MVEDVPYDYIMGSPQEGGSHSTFRPNGHPNPPWSSVILKRIPVTLKA